MKKQWCFVWILAAVFSAQVHAKSWLARKCEALLGTSSVEVEARHEKIQWILEEVAFRANRFSRHDFSVEIAPAEVLAGKQTTVQFRMKLASGLQWIQRPLLSVFANPAYLHLDWNGEKRTLSKAPALLAVIEDVELVHNGQVRRLTDVIADEVRDIRSANPSLRFDLRMSGAAEFSGAELRSSARDKLVLWVTGDIDNHHVQRILFLAIQSAFEGLANDPAYVRSRSIRP